MTMAYLPVEAVMDFLPDSIEEGVVQGQTDFGSQSEDMDAINRYMRTTNIVSNSAFPIKDDFIRWWDMLDNWDKTLSGDAYDEARTRMNKFNLANVRTEEERANVVRVITTGISTEEMQGKKKPPVLSTGEVGSQVTGRKSTTGTMATTKTATGATATSPVMPTIRQGSSGDPVKKWQSIIGVTADGKFGPATAAATKKWQSSHGLTADGIVGPATWAKAVPVAAPTPSVFLEPGETPTPAKPTLSLGASGGAVTEWQSIVGVKPTTGYFGDSTKVATVNWQKARGLTADGIVGPKTWEVALKGAAPFAPPPTPSFAPTPKPPAPAKPAPAKPAPAKPAPAKKPIAAKAVAQKAVVQTAGAFDVSKWPKWAQIWAGLTVAGGAAALIAKKLKLI